MSFLKRALASIGVGSARVDTVLDGDRAQPGGEVSGTVYVQGGDTAQTIDHVYLYLMTRYTRQVGDGESHQEHELATVKLRERLEVAPNGRHELPFTLPVPWATPLTLSSSRVWVKTGLSVARAVDPSDEDTLRVEPTEEMRVVLNALERLGFYLYKADNEYNGRLRREVPFVQELEFRPSGRLANRLKELEVILLPEPGRVRVLLEADLRSSGLMGALFEDLDLNERFTQLDLDASTLARGVDAVAAELDQAIQTRLH